MRAIVTAKDVEAWRQRWGKAEAELSAAESVQPPQAIPEPTKDSYINKLMKYVPSEIIVLFLFVDGLALRFGGDGRGQFLWMSWAACGFCVVATPFYLWRFQGVGPHKWLQWLLSTAAFVVWVFGVGGPFETLPWYSPAYAQALVAVYTFVAAFVDP